MKKQIKSQGETPDEGIPSAETATHPTVSADQARPGNELVIALTKDQYNHDKEYWQQKAQDQANARRREVLIITEDATPFRAKPVRKPSS